jgi:vacuolar-type H+-ATPase subunit F/Vma7
VEYYFEQTQNFLVEAYNMKDENQPQNIKAQEFIGSLEFQLH